MCKIIGYVRVSTQEQNLDRQLKAMDEYGVPKENVFSDHGFSGKDFNRPAYLAGEISARKAAKQLCISHSTFCNWVAQNS